MLKGHVFSKQLFGNPIFALFIDTFLNGTNGVSTKYKNGMGVSYSGNTVTVNSGAVCIQGRFLEEDSSTTLTAGTETAYCKLIIEIDLDKENTENDFTQGEYKIIKSATGYPNLTQTEIVKNVAGVYQYELARFRTSSSGITDFQDKRTFLDFTSIYDEMRGEYRAVLEQLEEELDSIEDRSGLVLKNDLAILEGQLTFQYRTPSQPSSGIYAELDINYPQGYNKDNCVVIAFGLAGTGTGNTEFAYGVTGEKAFALMAGSIPRMARLRNSGIHIEAYYNSDTYLMSRNYRIVLMKVS